MKILGIDVGFARTGWAVIETQPKQKNKHSGIRLVASGLIETHQRFKIIEKNSNTSTKSKSNITNRISLADFKSGNKKSNSSAEESIEIPYLLRLHENAVELRKVLEEYAPDCVSVEKIFFFKNQKTIINVTQSRGVILNTCLDYFDGDYTKIFEYTPLQVKSTLTGAGRADKKQVQYMVQQILKLDIPIKQDDEADAVANAITHTFFI